MWMNLASKEKGLTLQSGFKVSNELGEVDILEGVENVISIHRLLPTLLAKIPCPTRNRNARV